jgi:hypothetical protein
MRLQPVENQIKTIPMRDMIVILPGIMGSILQNKNGQEVWNYKIALKYNIVKALRNINHQIASCQLEQLLSNLKLNQEEDDQIIATGLMSRVAPLGIAAFGGYEQLHEHLKQHFTNIERAIVSHKEKAYNPKDYPKANVFEFPYDWRCDNRIAAEKLKQFIETQLPVWRRSNPRLTGQAKVILIAHSMGGLVARYYLEVLNGWEDCKKLITFGTPHSGSIKILDELANVYNTEFDPHGIVRSFTSIDQLMPLNKVVKKNNKYELVVDSKNPIPDDLRQKAVNGLKFHNEILKSVRYKDKDIDHCLKIYPVVGIRQPTFSSAELCDESQNIFLTKELPPGIPETWGDGDDTVPRYSAIPFEFKKCYTDSGNMPYYEEIPETHGFLQSNDAVLERLCTKLQQLETDPLGGDVRDPDSEYQSGQNEVIPPAISLEVEDVYILQSERQIQLYANLQNSTGEPQGTVELFLEDGTNKVPQSVNSFNRQDGRWVLTLDDPTPGLYQLTVTDSSNSQITVHGLFQVVDPNSLEMN